MSVECETKHYYINISSMSRASFWKLQKYLVKLAHFSHSTSQPHQILYASCRKQSWTCQWIYHLQIRRVSNEGISFCYLHNACNFKLHSKTSHVVTMPWLDSDWVVTILSPTSGTSRRLQNHVSVPPWFLHSDCVYQVPYVFPFSDFAVAVVYH